MAQLSGEKRIFSGDTAQVDTVQQFAFNTKAVDVDGNEYLYVKGVASGAVGRWVTYDEVGVTTLLVADAKGLVGVMCGVLDATTDFGWIQIFGKATASIADTSSDNTLIGYEDASGYAGDGYGAGDMIYGAMLREAVTTAANATVQITYPFVTDEST